jgi:hypothetical protein
MERHSRDGFTKDICRTLQERAGNHCSRPDCRRLTSGPNLQEDKATRTGVGAHITAASRGGPRYNPALSPLERSSAANGIWLCELCARIVDADPIRYPVALLYAWKQAAEEWAHKGSTHPSPQPIPVTEQGWECPYCGTVAPHGRRACKGCLAEVVYGATRRERQSAARTGIYIAGFGGLLLFFALPNLLPWHLPPGLGLGLASFPVMLVISLTGGQLMAHAEEKRRRMHPPRFFRSSVS